jgi:hypothetical protein
MGPQETTPQVQSAPPAKTNDHGKDVVTVTINGDDKNIHRGSYLVSELKTALGVEAAKELDEVIGGDFKPLDDTARITIKGGEAFVGHARRGGSS